MTADAGAHGDRVSDGPGSHDSPGSHLHDRDALLERFASFPQRLAGAARTAEGRPAPKGEWTTAEVVRHLIAV